VKEVVEYGGNYRTKERWSREEFSESKKIEKSNDFNEIKEIKKSNDFNFPTSWKDFSTDYFSVEKGIKNRA
jgi:hypothetical protein